jgi:2-oxoglutarate dehydrogenase E1 component
VSEADLYQDVLAHMREGVLSVDLHGRVLTFNAAAGELLGLAPDDVTGQLFGAVFLERDGFDDFVQCVLDAVYDSTVAHHRRVDVPAVDGPRTLEVTTSFLARGDARARAGVVAVFSDVTEVLALRASARALEELRVEQLVRAYRERGHAHASLDPLGHAREQVDDELALERFGLTAGDLERAFTVELAGSPTTLPLGRIVEELEDAYCGAVGVQYTHIDDQQAQSWLRERLESPDRARPLPREEQLRVLRKLVDAETLESFLQQRFPRSKRFSLEGAETLIPLLDGALAHAVARGAREVVIGMSHRGRLNVLANVLDVSPRELFRRFEGLEDEEADAPGDVRFHLGVERQWKGPDGDARVSLCFNPSHLELVGPVVLGRSRSRLDARGGNTASVVPLIIHGDAAIAGQGIVQELLNLSQLPAYAVGGAVHLVLNNQIGFTTLPDQGRSTQYATDIARMLQAPIFHVNGERPEAVDRVTRLALDFRARWQRDVVVDMYCYRRRGHMEQDDPTFTQPELYELLSDRARLRETYADNLVALGQLTAEDVDEILRASEDQLDVELSHTSDVADRSLPRARSREAAIDTRVDCATLSSLLKRLSSTPPSFKPHKKVAALLRRRARLAEGTGRVDWAMGETLAYASLLAQGISVRLTGQDSERGTFGHRHATLHDVETGARHYPLRTVAGDGARVDIHNSPLSESAVLAFELGYSLDGDGLVLWEAQFGDFANMAQAVIDQFVVASDAKWEQASGLTLLLPHGLEGGGPEHSSARPERYLQLAAAHNVDIVFLTTAAQVFHRLRAQGLAPRRPLIAFTPKKLLQHPASAVSIEELCTGRFEPIVGELVSADTKHVVLTCGQLGVELARLAERHESTAVLRLEQLYPFPADEIARRLARLPADAQLTWAQEEPENMGAWRWLHPQLESLAGRRPIRAVTRPEAASPATGSKATHDVEHAALLASAFVSGSN